MFAAGVTRALNARHVLHGDFGDESVPHSHPYEVELICRAATLDDNGFSTDIAAMEAVLEEILEEINGVLLNDLTFFADRQPSLEHLCVYLAVEARTRLDLRDAAPAEPLEIRIRESDTAWASYIET